MEQSFELASKTEVSVDALRGVDSRALRGAMFDYYASVDPTLGDYTFVGSLLDVPTVEEQARRFESDHRALYTLAMLYSSTLKRFETTNVPGHGTVTDVSVADGHLGVQGNLLVEGTLLVAGDLSVGGQLILAEGAIVIVVRSLNTSAISGSGHLTVGGDLRAMFVDVQGASLDVGGVLDAFLLIQNEHHTRASEFSIGLHAVLTEHVTAADVFLPAMLDASGKPDWTVIARAAQAADDVFRADYHTPQPAANSPVQLLR